MLAAFSSAEIIVSSFSGSIALKPPPASPRSFQSGHDPFPGQGAEYAEQEGSLRRGRVHVFGQGPKPYLLGLKPSDDLEQMRERAAKSVQLPHHQAVAGTIRRGPARLVLEQVTFIYANGEQGIPLQVPLSGSRNRSKLACIPSTCPQSPTALCSGIDLSRTMIFAKILAGWRGSSQLLAAGCPETCVFGCHINLNPGVQQAVPWTTTSIELQ